MPTPIKYSSNALLQRAFDFVRMAHRVTDSLNEAPQRRDVASSTVIYEGRTLDKSVDGTNVAKWQIARILISGNQTIREYASGVETFNKIWDNRATYFSPPPFLNQYSIQFDGVNDQVLVAHNASLSFDRLNPFSISMWVKTTAGNCTYIEKGNLLPGYRIEVSASRLTFEIANAVGNRVRVRTNVNITYNNGNWHHICITYSGSSTAAGVAIYVDGVAEALNVQNDTLTLAATNAESLSIGAKTGGGAAYVGFIDEVAVFDVAVSAANVAVLYNAGQPADLSAHPNAASRRANWRMGDLATFPTIPDIMLTNNGTMTNQVAGNIVTVVP